MLQRARRFGLFLLPAVSCTLGVIGACTDDESPTTTAVDASADVTSDGSAADSTVEPADAADAGPDAEDLDSSTDAGRDANLPALCLTYPNIAIPSDAGAGEPPNSKRYDLIALRALVSQASANASSSCEVSSLFHVDDNPDAAVPFLFALPIQPDCLGRQLAYLTGCEAAGAYESDGRDMQGTRCVPDASADGVVYLGFRNPDVYGYHQADVDFVIRLIRQAAIGTGMAAADADRLKALLEEKRSFVVTRDAGADAGDAGFSASTCP